MTMIVTTTDNRNFRVREDNDPGLEHVWIGIPVKLVKGVWVPKAHAKQQLVRKEGSTVLQGPKSWAPEVLVEGRWSRNAVRFAKEADAARAASDLFSRWTACQDHRATPADEAANCTLVEGRTVFVEGAL